MWWKSVVLDGCFPTTNSGCDSGAARRPAVIGFRVARFRIILRVAIERFACE
jgi:hypothetical protein